MASGSSDIRLWNLDNLSAEPTVLEGHDDIVWWLAYSPDGQTLASGSEDETIRLWDTANFNSDPTVLSGHDGRVWAGAFSPDGQSLVTGSTDRTVRIWDMTQEDQASDPLVLTRSRGECTDSRLSVQTD